MISDREWRARVAAFDVLSDMGAPESELPRATLTRGFDLDGIRVPLIGAQGIWSPAGFRVPLSITTIPLAYSDRVDESTKQLRYSYRRTGPDHRDNVGLRRAIAEKTPLIYFFRTDPSYYLATYPVYVVGDDRQRQEFNVVVDEQWVLNQPPALDSAADVDAPLRRAYATRVVRQRLFQAEFRRRVMEAYRRRCALYHLRHRELLDAAHITADSTVTGEPVVSNGMALCKLHHAAFDKFFFTVDTSYRVVVRPSILTEADGPMLVVGLQQIHGELIDIPRELRNQPDRDRLALRYELFRRAS